MSHLKVTKTDINDRRAVTVLVQGFYDKVLSDPVLSVVFIDIANIDIQQHLPRIIDYWCKMLFSDPQYSNHTMAIHRRLNNQSSFQEQHFELWLKYFLNTVDELFLGSSANRAKDIARKVINNMKSQFFTEQSL